MWNLRCPFRLKLKGGGVGEKAQGRPHHACPAAPTRLAPASPLPAEVARKGLLVGVGQHVPSQVLLVLGGKATLAALVGPQARVLRHVGLEKGQSRSAGWGTTHSTSRTELAGHILRWRGAT